VARPRLPLTQITAEPWLREDELAASPQAKNDYQRGVTSGALPPEPLWASQAIDLITDLPPAAEVVAGLAAQAEDTLARILSRAGGAT
jgi:nitronate monooxygenase